MNEATANHETKGENLFSIYYIRFSYHQFHARGAQGIFIYLFRFIFKEKFYAASLWNLPQAAYKKNTHNRNIKH